MRRILQKTINLAFKFLSHISPKHLEKIFEEIIQRRISNLPSKDALIFLFRIEAALYPLQGQKSVEYDNGVHTKHRHMRYHDFFVNRISEGEKVLDLGCGIGAVSCKVAKMVGASVTGVDKNGTNIAKAKQTFSHPKVKYVCGDITKDHLVSETYDVIILSNVLEHLNNRVEFLLHIQKKFKPSRFLIRVPLFERDWRVPLKKELGVEWRLDLDHKIEYTIESFFNETSAAGLSISCQEVRWSEIWAELEPRKDAGVR